MNKKSKIDEVMTVVALRDGKKWIIHSCDEITVQSWSVLDKSESEKLGLELCCSNIRSIKNSNESNDR